MFDQGAVSRSASSLFGSVAKGGGGFLSSLFGGSASANATASGAQGLTLESLGILSTIGKIFGFANGGIMGPNGQIPLHTYSNGGIANSPQMAIFGEGRMNEAYVPLSDGKRIPVAMSQPANGNSGPQKVDNSRSFTIDARGAQMGVADQIVKALQSYDSEKTRTQADDRGLGTVQANPTHTSAAIKIRKPEPIR